MASKKPKLPLILENFTVLPILLPLPKTLDFPEKQRQTHYLYIQPHEPRLPDPNSVRSLFIANIPIATTEAYLRHLFGTQLHAGRVESVCFPHAAETTVTPRRTIAERKKLQKRKRQLDASESLATLSSSQLPQVWEHIIHPSGSHAILLFPDRASAVASLSAVKRAAKHNTPIIWGDGLPASKTSTLGADRYLGHHRASYPDQSDLLRSVNTYMTLFGQLEDARRREERSKRQKPDEDGFVTVTRGPKAEVVGERSKDGEEGKKEKEGLSDFYRFQMREQRKDAEGRLRREFERDRARVHELRRARGRVWPE